MTIGIEYVCTGNSGRSPMAETIANDYVLRNGFEDRVKIFSSGTNHNPLFVGQRDDPEKLLAIVKLGLNNEIFRGRIKYLAESVVDGSKRDKAIIDTCIGYLVKAEGIFRNMALLELGLTAEGEYHQPTMPQEGVDLILPMTEQNAEQVRKIYADSGLYPIIVPLNQYAGIEGDVTNPFCQLLPAYQKTRDDLLVSVPKTVDRALEELL